MIVADRAQDLAALAMAGIQHAAQLVGLAEEGVGLVDQQRRTISLDHAKQRGRGYVGGRQRAPDQPAEHIEQCGFAAALHRRADGQPRRDQKTVEQIGMHAPQRRSVARMFGHDDVALERGRNLIEQRRTVDRLGPWLGLGK